MVCKYVKIFLFLISFIKCYKPPQSFTDLLTRNAYKQPVYNIRLEEPQKPDDNSQSLANLSKMLEDLKKDEASELSSFSSLIEKQNKTLAEINRLVAPKPTDRQEQTTKLS